MFTWYKRNQNSKSTDPPCSKNVCMHSLLVLSHTLTVLSSLQDTISRPSGDHLAHRTQLLCWVRENWNLCLWTVHTCKANRGGHYQNIWIYCALKDCIQYYYTFTTDTIITDNMHNLLMPVKSTENLKKKTCSRTARSSAVSWRVISSSCTRMLQ